MKNNICVRPNPEMPMNKFCIKNIDKINPNNRNNIDATQLKIYAANP